MIASIKSSVEKTKHFANTHKTLVACAITAAVASKLTYNVTIDHVVKNANDYLQFANGDTLDSILVGRGVLLAFVNENDLQTDFVEFVQNL